MQHFFALILFLLLGNVPKIHRYKTNSNFVIKNSINGLLTQSCGN